MQIPPLVQPKASPLQGVGDGKKAGGRIAGVSVKKAYKEIVIVPTTPEVRPPNDGISPGRDDVISPGRDDGISPGRDDDKSPGRDDGISPGRGIFQRSYHGVVLRLGLCFSAFVSHALPMNPSGVSYRHLDGLVLHAGGCRGRVQPRNGRLHGAL